MMGWQYDKVGNRLTQDRWDGSITTTTTSSYNDANQLITTVEGGITTTTYAYDANGNLTAKAQSGNTWNWGYDYENRQVSYTDPITSVNNANYVYSASGNRIQKTVNSVTEKFIYDGVNIIADYNLVSGNWNLESSYVTPFLDQNLLVSRIVNQVSETYYFMHDGLGSVRNLVNSAESVVNSYDYTAFGEALNWSESIANRYTYTSREWDNESTTYHYRARQYNPSVGRFTVRDPIEYEDGINIYRYVMNNPADYTDPFGKEMRYKAGPCNQDDRCCLLFTYVYDLPRFGGSITKCIEALGGGLSKYPSATIDLQMWVTDLLAMLQPTDASDIIKPPKLSRENLQPGISPKARRLAERMCNIKECVQDEYPTPVYVRRERDANLFEKAAWYFCRPHDVYGPPKFYWYELAGYKCPRNAKHKGDGN